MYWNVASGNSNRGQEVIRSIARLCHDISFELGDDTLEAALLHAASGVLNIMPWVVLSAVRKKAEHRGVTDGSEKGGPPLKVQKVK
jgi:hypothetical protein